ncbi:MAG TPA: hypothetical protein VJY35_02500, partial [Candidatus Eisenbacteria bacterium]|nr:hypothetical protein [Candidatus Eisenbacteria bacterium]
MPRLPRLDPTIAGGLLCALGFGLLTWPSLLVSAVGLELFSAGFWFWARVAEDRREQLPRWAWLKRPALALWLAAGLQAVAPDHVYGLLPPLSTPVGALARVGALAVLWGSLELMAALPLARPASVRPGPLGGTGPWLPVMLPAAGFLVLWRHGEHWTRVPEVRALATVLLLVTAALAALRAFSRREWMASLRWLVIGDSALAGTLVALRAVTDDAAMLLWMGATGGHALLLAGELGGAEGRRGNQPHRLWRIAVWVALASMSWPIIATLGFGPPEVANPILALIAAVTVALATLVSVGRLEQAPDRRTLVRREAAIPLVQLGALATLMSGPLALFFAWWGGFEPGFVDSLASLVPAIVGGWAGGLGERPEPARLAAVVALLGKVARQVALTAFHAVVGFERALQAVLSRVARALAAPARDLHTGDAQEFLLFL